MKPRSGPGAPVLGILLILLGLACLGFYFWGNAPMEEPANPGKTPRPLSDEEVERLIRRTVWMVRFQKYGAIPGGLVFLIVGSLLVLPEKTRPA